MTEIKAEVPMAEMLNYAPDLRSITGGRGDYTMEFLRYEEVPAHLAQKVISAAGRRGGSGRQGVDHSMRHGGSVSVRRLPNIEEARACEVCGRTMLKGEQAEPYLTPSRERRMVCTLCAPRAQQEGWIRESAAPETPTRPARTDERRGILRFARRRRSHGRLPTAGPGAGPRQRSEDEPGADGAIRRPRRARRSAASGRRPRSPRHVRAVPTNAQLKIDRALDLFNESEHRRTVTGIIRALGTPHASASTSPVSAAQVLLTVAWELSWYQFVIDLSDGRDPVQVRNQGQELDELPEQAQAVESRGGRGRLDEPARGTGGSAAGSAGRGAAGRIC